MDIIILRHLRSNPHASGYDIIKLLHRQYRMLASPGTVYSVLYSLERQSLAEGIMSGGKRLYTLTQQGEKLLRQLCGTKIHVQTLLSIIFSEL
jgi:DNA-binding PadR family transcriptional regulator